MKNMEKAMQAVLPACIAQSGMGKNRDPWLIRRFLGGMGITMTQVASMAGTRHQVVSDTLRGIRNHRRTLAALESLGCPLDLLYPQNQYRRAA
jgi:hypothetical protein